MVRTRDSFVLANGGIVAGDLSPLAEEGNEGQCLSTTPRGNAREFSEGLDSSSAPHVKMAKAHVSSFINAASSVNDHSQEAVPEASIREL